MADSFDQAPELRKSYGELREALHLAVSRLSRASALSESFEGASA
jgi:hypothetical protein